jgi:hypothetical protein
MEMDIGILLFELIDFTFDINCLRVGFLFSFSFSFNSSFSLFLSSLNLCAIFEFFLSTVKQFDISDTSEV